MDIRRKIVLLLLVVALLLTLGTAGFHKLEGWALLDSFYATVITLATVGYGDVTPTTPLAQTLAWMEAIAGQFYLAILVAGIVGFKVTQAMRR
jgi:voltage-gated potassium channel